MKPKAYICKIFIYALIMSIFIGGKCFADMDSVLTIDHVTEVLDASGARAALIVDLIGKKVEDRNPGEEFWTKLMNLAITPLADFRFDFSEDVINEADNPPIEAKYIEASISFDQHNYRKAAGLYQSCLEKHVLLPRSGLDAAISFLKAGYHESALIALDQLDPELMANSEKLEFDAYKSFAHYSLGNTPEAIRVASEGRDRFNGSSILCVLLGEYYYRSGNPDEGMALLNRAIREGVEAGRIVRGFVHYDKGRFEVALKDYDELLRQNPADYSALNGKARCHLALKDYEAAYYCLYAAVRFHPDNREVLMQLVDLGISLKKFNQIEKLLTEFALTHRNDWDALFEVGRMSFVTGTYDTVKFVFEKVLRDAPLTDIQKCAAAQMLSLVYSAGGEAADRDLEKGLAYAEKARSIFPKDEDVAYALCIANLNKGSFDEALECLRAKIREQGEPTPEDAFLRTAIENRHEVTLAEIALAVDRQMKTKGVCSSGIHLTP